MTRLFPLAAFSALAFSLQGCLGMGNGDTMHCGQLEQRVLTTTLTPDSPVFELRTEGALAVFDGTCPATVTLGMGFTRDSLQQQAHAGSGRHSLPILGLSENTLLRLLPDSTVVPLDTLGSKPWLNAMAELPANFFYFQADLMRRKTPSGKGDLVFQAALRPDTPADSGVTITAEFSFYSGR